MNKRFAVRLEVTDRFGICQILESELKTLRYTLYLLKSIKTWFFKKIIFSMYSNFDQNII